jgi:23S rRNA (cytosine1962-C5)-methyltransferase
MTDIITTGWDHYRLLDSGEGRKLEKFGPYVVDRPEQQAMWARAKPELWDRADAVFAGENDAEDGRWNFSGNALDETFPVELDGLHFTGRFTAFRHMGFFPEQLPHWEWMLARVGDGSNVLNLFGYTGLASLLAARQGAKVTHVDASKKAIGWARESQSAAGLDDAKIRWICEDARSFTAREGRRGNTYDCILLDPPKFGRGANKEVWELFEDLREMLVLCREVLADKGCIILTAYAVRASHHALYELCAEVFPGATLESGELVVAPESGGAKVATSLFCRVQK